MVVSDYLTEIAEVAVSRVLALTFRHLSGKHGRPGAIQGDGTGFMVLGYGKMGGIELGYGSDLDLVFLHGSDSVSAMTDGGKQISNDQFYMRLGQRMIHMMTTQTSSGQLYEVDMRLRPDGNKGMLVRSLSSFAGYQANDAWTWEHQALVRARPVAGDPLLAERFGRVRREILCLEREAEGLRKDVREMRERMRENLDKTRGGRFDLKQGRGGIADIEFMVQYSVLRWAARHPELADWTDNVRLLETLARLELLPWQYGRGFDRRLQGSARRLPPQRSTGAANHRPRRPAGEAAGAGAHAVAGADGRLRCNPGHTSRGVPGYPKEHAETTMTTMADRDGLIWLDGEMVPWREAKTHVLTHTLHYGMGVFEGVRAYRTDQGRRHLPAARAHRAAVQLRPYPGHADALRPRRSWTRPSARRCGRTASTPPTSAPCASTAPRAWACARTTCKVHCMVAAWEWGAYLGEDNMKNGIRIKVSSFTRHHVNITMCRAKANGNYMNSMLALQEALRDGYDEALLLDAEGYVMEGSGENIFIVREGVLYTPDLTSALDGITRKTVMSLAGELGIEVVEKRITRDEVYIADEAFFTGTAAEVTPIREVDGRAIGGGTRGPITERLQELYFDQVHGRRDEHPEWLTLV